MGYFPPGWCWSGDDSWKTGWVKKVIILGSTGSIGTQALEVIAENRDRFTVAGLAAGGGRVDVLEGPRGLAGVAEHVRETFAAAVEFGEAALRAVGVPENEAAAIAEAREHGDLSENAEYHAAREKQGFIEGRIKELESILSRAEQIDTSKLSGSVKFGAIVNLVDEDTDEERTYQIVGEAEADIERGLLNVRSPLARALIGKDEGDSVEVTTPGGLKSYEILSIRYE